MLQALGLGFSRRSFRQLSYLHKPTRRGKLYQPCEAISSVLDGSTVLVGGFGLCGSPERLLHELDHQQRNSLTIVCADAGNDEGGLGSLLRHHRVKCLITAHAQHSHLAMEQYERGKLDLQLVTQGTLSERLRAAAAGLPAFYTAVGAGTQYEDGGLVTHRGDHAELSGGREIKEFEGRRCVMETALKGDFALVKAWRADLLGNLCFRGTTRGFNDTMCGAARVTVALAEEVLPIGSLPAEAVHVPGPMVQKLVKGKPSHKLEGLTLRRDPSAESESLLPHLPSSQALTMMLGRVAFEAQSCSSLYLGPGCPSQLPRVFVLDPAVRVVTASGAIGAGPFPGKREEVDADMVDGSKRTVMALEGVSFASSHQTAALLRGGHIDLVVVTANEISQYGDIACNLPDAMNGTMDAAAAHANGTRVVCMMGHVTPEGLPRLVSHLALPLTAEKCVDLLITEKAVFEVDAEKGLTLIEIAHDVHMEDVVSLTGVEFAAALSVVPIKQAVNHLPGPSNNG